MSTLRLRPEKPPRAPANPELDAAEVRVYQARQRIQRMAKRNGPMAEQLQREARKELDRALDHRAEVRGRTQ